MYVYSIYFFTGSKSNGHVKAAAAAVSSSTSGIKGKVVDAVTIFLSSFDIILDIIVIIIIIMLIIIIMILVFSVYLSISLHTLEGFTSSTHTNSMDFTTTLIKRLKLLEIETKELKNKIIDMNIINETLIDENELLKVMLQDYTIQKTTTSTATSSSAISSMSVSSVIVEVKELKRKNQSLERKLTEIEAFLGMIWYR